MNMFNSLISSWIIVLRREGDIIRKNPFREFPRRGYMVKRKPPHLFIPSTATCVRGMISSRRYTVSYVDELPRSNVVARS
jgi:hypothetical protein